jgi:superoxide dismutase
MQSWNHLDYHHRDHHQTISKHLNDDLSRQKKFRYEGLIKFLPPFFSAIRLDPPGDSANIKIR